MKQIDFKEQICTTMEQSERLLELGLKKETSDMVWLFNTSVNRCDETCAVKNVIYEPDENDIPAWSLFRLVQIISEGMKHVNSNKPWVIEIFNPEHIFDNCIEMIGHLISTEHINKKYLNVKQ